MSNEEMSYLLPGFAAKVVEIRTLELGVVFYNNSANPCTCGFVESIPVYGHCIEVCMFMPF
jgi:hypothetical protein